MRLTQLLKFVSIITLLSLGYIDMQMQIINLAYQGKEKEQEIRKLTEENGFISYNISVLKSANHLGFKILAENSELQFADSGDIIQISSTEGFAEGGSIDQIEGDRRNPLLSFLSIGAQAEAGSHR